MRVLSDKNNRAIAVVALCVIARLIGHFLTGYLVDDALITFRYAENIASGNGFVYNLGERVMGTTTPLFTLLLAGFASIGVPTTAAALSLSTLFAALTAFTLVRFGDRSLPAKIALLPAILYALYPRSLICDISGLETALFTFLLTYAIYELFRMRHLQASVTAALACVTRPEGIGVLAIVIAVSLIDRARHLWRIVIPPLVMLGSWLIFSSLYFGSLLPNSLPAKSALYEAGAVGFVHRLGQMMTLGPFVGLAAFALLLAVTLWFLIQRDRLLIASVTAIGFVAGLAYFSPRVFYWYAAPALPLLFLTFAKGSGFVIDRYEIRLRATLTAALIASVLAVVSFLHLRRLSAEMNWYNANHIAAAEYLNSHASPTDIVLAEDIGHFGYHYRGNIVDRDGLISPQAINYNRSQEYLKFVDSVNADWIFIATVSPAAQAILSSPQFEAQYEESRFQPGNENQTHRLFHHR
jgi:arabinofuranosyltransferase